MIKLTGGKQCSVRPVGWERVGSYYALWFSHLRQGPQVENPEKTPAADDSKRRAHSAQFEHVSVNYERDEGKRRAMSADLVLKQDSEELAAPPLQVIAFTQDLRLLSKQ